jgi:hypothetical protein
VGTTENMDFLFVKISSQGEFDWSATYGSNDMVSGRSILQRL